MDLLNQGISANTSIQTKMAEAHSTTESWQNSLNPQRSHTERSLANRKNVSYRQQRHTAAVSTKSRQTGNYEIPAVRLVPIEAEERLHHGEDSDGNEEQEAKIITQ